MRKTRTIKEQLDELIREVSAARMHYEIYHVFTNEFDRPKFTDTMNRYIDFFAPAISAHFGSMVTCLGIIYDKHPKSIHVHKLIKAVEAIPSLDKIAIQNLKSRLEKNGPLVRKALALRNNVIAHLSEASTIKEVFKRAAVSRYNFRDLIEDTGSILQEIGRLVGESYLLFGSSSEDGTRAMLIDLLKFREYCLAHPEEILSFQAQGFGSTA